MSRSRQPTLAGCVCSVLSMLPAGLLRPELQDRGVSVLLLEATMGGTHSLPSGAPRAAHTPQLRAAPPSSTVSCSPTSLSYEDAPVMQGHLGGSANAPSEDP